jgi:enoyl-CoA hydratase
LQPDLTRTYETLLVEPMAAGAVVRITINRPTVLNALNKTVLSELHLALSAIAGSREIRVVTIEGAGEKAFVAGADIAQIQKLSPTEALHFAELGQGVTSLMESMPQIVIGKVRGFALGGGCELAMACDIVVAASNSKFGQPEVNLGLVPGFGGTQRLARRVGLPVALDMICSGRGRTLKAEEALQAGLVSRVVEVERLDAETSSLIDALLAAAPEAVRACKRLVRDSVNMELGAGLRAEATSFAHCWPVGEAQEGMQAFQEKRTPAFATKRPQP